MARIRPVDESSAPPASQELAAAHVATGSRMTNMKWTLAHSPVALDALLAAGPMPPGPAVRIARQIASAVDALEEAGAAPPPLVPERIWVDESGNAYLDGLDGHIGLTMPAASSSAALARLLGEMTTRVTEPLQTVVTRALDGAYLSAGQLANELRRIETVAAERRRVTALTVVAMATLALAIVLIVVVG